MSLADESSLLFIPTGYKESKIYSVFPTTGVGDFTFNRNSSATRIAKNGLITSVATDIPRLDYPLIDGVVNGCPSLLLEPQRTNLVTYSEDFSNAYWTKVNSAGSTLPNVTSNYGISPDGSLNADRIQVSRASGAADFSSVYKSITTSSVNRAHSIWLKSLSGTPTILILNNDGTYVSQQITTEWVRYELDLGVGTITEIQLSVVGSNFVANVSESADFLAYGAQLEEGSYATSYIPTNGTTVTRLADTATGAGDASTFNDSEGVLMAEISALADDLSIEGVSINNGSASNRVVIFKWNTSNTIRARVTSNSVNTFDFDVVVSDITNFNKIALKYKENDFALWINGIEVATDSIGATPIGLSELGFDSDGLGGADFYGKTKQIQYFQTALTDSELEQLTSWISFTDLANGQQYSIK